MFYRDTWIEVDLDRFTHNLQCLQEATNKKVICVVKANAYGHGDCQITKEAIAFGCPYIAVSSLDEAMHLRHHFKEVPILVLGYVRTSDIQIAKQANITLTVPSLSWAEEIGKQDIQALKFHIKVDTGMNRLGIKKIDELKTTLQLLSEKSANVEGIYTHYHSADGKDKTSAIKQRDWFYRTLDTLEYPFTWIHSTNSDASLSIEDTRCNAIRVGLAAYGIPRVPTTLTLQPILSLYTKIVSSKRINKNETVGYGATYTCLEEEYIATIPIGYGDGFIRQNQGRFVCINSTPYEVIGRVCMDQCMIRLKQDQYPIGTTVELIGKHSDLESMANQLHTIPYEVLCLLSDRIPRVYYKKGKMIDSLDLRNKH